MRYLNDLIASSFWFRHAFKTKGRSFVTKTSDHRYIAWRKRPKATHITLTALLEGKNFRISRKWLGTSMVKEEELDDTFRL